ncbi:MAG: DNA cytosine methyltransferase [Alphaproteobacteria bacterium]|nr:DNA cytosine methyltransferase [Alphaproteobacteria bacterium]
MLTVLDLFSGIGGFSLGLEATGGFETVAFVEIDKDARKVLADHWPGVPIHEDIHDLTGEEHGAVDVVTGGFPCQPWSCAGHRRGADDHRDLWPEMRRVIAAVGPRWVVAENVPGLDDERFMGLDRACADLEGLGYSVVPLEIPACAVGAPHRRQRLWIVAHCVRPARQQDAGRAHTDEAEHAGGRATPDHRPAGDGEGDELGNADIAPKNAHPSQGRSRGAAGQSSGVVVDAARDGRRQGRAEPDVQVEEGQAAAGRGLPCWDDAEWIAGHDGKAQRVEPGVRLLVDGLPGRVAALRLLGNAVVPQVVERIGWAILEAEHG